MKRSQGTILSATDLASTESYSIDVERSASIAVQVIYSDSAPAAKTFADADVSVADNTIAISSHGYVTGTKVAATTTGVLPGGLSATNYYVISLSASSIKLASSLANAEAGTAVDITSAAGGGTHTLTPATSSGNVAKLQESNDGTNWHDVSSATVTIATTAGNDVWEYTRSARYLQVLYTPSAGQVSLTILTSVIG